MCYQDVCERLRDEQQMLNWSILIERSEEDEEVLDDVEEDES